MRRVLSLVSAAVLLTPVSGSAAPGPAYVTTVQMPRGANAEAAFLADVDGDGADDLVVAVSERRKRFRRSVRVHLRREGLSAFATDPTYVRDLTPDVVAFAAGDVHEDAGSEIVLFTATGAFAWRPQGPEDERPRKLLEADFLWQLPHHREVFHWTDGVQDVDGDGLDDLVLPEPDGYRIAVQRRAMGANPSFALVSAPRIPSEAALDPSQSRGARRKRGRDRRAEIKVQLGFGSDLGEATPGDLLAVEESVPAPKFLDWDGDGDAELLAQTGEEILVWAQDGGRFSQQPVHRELLPLEVDRSRRLDVSFSTHAADLDQDGVVDCVILAGDRRSEDVRTQILVYLNGKGRGSAAKTAEAPLFGPKGLPQQALLVGGFAGFPWTGDVNGDGRPDLVVGSIRVDTLDAIRASSSGTLDAELYVYLNRGGRFSRQPDASVTVPVPAKGLRRVRRRFLARFLGDVTGNGMSDLLLRDQGERLRLLRTVRTRNGLQVVEEPLWETRIGDRASVVLREGAGPKPPEVVVVENAQVLHVRFRP